MIRAKNNLSDEALDILIRSYIEEGLGRFEVREEEMDEVFELEARKFVTLGDVEAGVPSFYSLTNKGKKYAEGER